MQQFPALVWASAEKKNPCILGFPGFCAGCIVDTSDASREFLATFWIILYIRTLPKRRPLASPTHPIVTCWILVHEPPTEISRDNGILDRTKSTTYPAGQTSPYHAPPPPFRAAILAGPLVRTHRRTAACFSRANRPRAGRNQGTRDRRGRGRGSYHSSHF